MAGADRALLKVDRRNRLLTLCVMAERDIKDFAEAAFFDNPKRYNRDYTRTRPGPASGTPRSGPPASAFEPAHCIAKARARIAALPLAGQTVGPSMYWVR